MTNTTWLLSEWNVHFADVMQAMADVKPQMAFTSIESLPQGEFLWWKQPFSCAHDSPVWVGASDLSWAAIGQLVLSSAGVEGSPADEVRSTYLEIISQSVAGLARAISGRLAAEVTCGEGVESQPEPSANQLFEVTAKMTETQTISLYLATDQSLAAAIAVPAPASDNKADQPGQGSDLNNDLSHVAGSRTFELLLDVELPISVSFGRTSLRVQEAMNLVSGSLIELDRAISDPVDLLVNNCVIARGEVVVIEGNYGIRLTEIVSHKERLQQSRRYILT